LARNPGLKAFCSVLSDGTGAISNLLFAQAWVVKAGQLFRIVCTDGPQVADVNFWNLHNPKERFYASKTRQLHASHLKAHDRSVPAEKKNCSRGAAAVDNRQVRVVVGGGVMSFIMVACPQLPAQRWQSCCPCGAASGVPSRCRLLPSAVQLTAQNWHHTAAAAVGLMCI
jgi:hypothetical protein